MAGPIRISILANGSQARREIQGFGSTLKRALGAGAALLGGYGVVEGLKSVVTEASAAQQSLGATEAIFGKYADQVVKKSNEAADAVGLSGNAYRESANLLGALFKNQGVQLDKLSGQTDKHLALAADLSAMYGGPVTDAVDALTAAYKGEFNQLEKYGVTLKQDTINTEANRVAKQKYGKELSDLPPKLEATSKQLATQQLLFKQTADAQGTFADESDTLAGQQQRLQAELDNVQAEIGTALLPVLTDLARWARDEVVPALEDFAGWLKENQDEIRDAGQAVGDTLLPPLKDLVGVVVDAARWFSGLPRPVKELAVQAGVAAYALPKVSAALTVLQARAATAGGSVLTLGQRLQQNRAAMTYQATAIGKAREALHGFGGAARNAAGVGGLVALTSGLGDTDAAASNADQAMGTLTKTLGGAGVGAAVGGLWGAAIGGAAGLATSLFDMLDATKETTKAAQISSAGWQTYADSLDRATGAITRATRAQVIQWLQEKDLLGTAGELKIGQQTLVDGILGREGAQKRLNAALEKQLEIDRLALGIAEDNPDLYKDQGMSDEAIEGLKKEMAARIENLEAIQDEAGAIQKSQQNKREEIRLLARIPKRVVTRFENLGLNPGIKDVKALQRQYGLTPRQVRTALELAGVDTSTKRIKGVIGELRKVDDTRVTLKGWVQGIKTAIDEGASISDRERRTIVTKLEAIKEAHPDLAPYVNSVRTAVNNARGAAGGSSAVGNELKQGLLNGMYGTGSALSAIMAGAVRDAIAAARAAARSKSPSKETEAIGRDLGLGLALGMRRQRKKAKTEGQKLMQAVLQGVRGGTRGADPALEKISRAIAKHVDLKSDKKEAARERALMKRYRDEYAAIRRNAKAQDRVAASLDKARDKLRQLTEERRQYAQTIKDSVLSFGSVIGLGAQEDGSVVVSSLIDQLKGRVNDAKRFSDLVQTLQSQGLNRTSIEQMLQAGPEAALATAEAIASGGQAAVDEINALTSQLAQSGGQLGDEMASRYFDAGVKAAEGVVKGLEAQARNLDKAAVKLANELVKAVKKALGIKSPSRVFEGIGDQVTKGLAIGLDETYVRSSAASLASALQQGFGTPALEAYASQRAAGASQGTVQVTVVVPPTADKASIGRELQSALDAYYRQGGRRAA